MTILSSADFFFKISEKFFKEYNSLDLGLNTSRRPKLPLAFDGLTLKAPITTSAEDKFCDIFPNFQKI